MRFRARTRRRFTPHIVLLIIICILSCTYFLLSQKQVPQNDIVLLAKQYLGSPYRYGGSSPAGFDCSGYILFLFHQFGKELPRTADQQATLGEHVNIGCLRPGDVVFFATDEPTISHSGLYIGDDQFIHASSSAKKVIISSLNAPYWRDAYRGARRMLR